MPGLAKLCELAKNTATEHHTYSSGRPEGMSIHQHTLALARPMGWLMVVNVCDGGRQPKSCRGRKSSICWRPASKNQGGNKNCQRDFRGVVHIHGGLRVHIYGGLKARTSF